MKHMHRLIMTSATYQQSVRGAQGRGGDRSGNRLLWAFPRHRLEGEVIRDASLYVAGLLNLKVGGPSVFPELPDGMGAPRGGWKVSAKDDRNRRSVYIFVRRNHALPDAGSVRHAGHARILPAPQRHHHRAAGPDDAERQGGAGMGAGLRGTRARRRRTRWTAPSNWPIPRPPDAWEKDTSRPSCTSRRRDSERVARARNWRCLHDAGGMDPTCRGARRFLPDAAELQRIRLSELSHETACPATAANS